MRWATGVSKDLQARLVNRERQGPRAPKEGTAYLEPPALRASKAKKGSRACKDFLDLQEQMECT